MILNSVVYLSSSEKHRKHNIEIFLFNIMNDEMAKAISTFFSIVVIALVTWAVSFCCYFGYYHCRKSRVERLDDDVLTDMTLPKSGLRSDIGKCQIQIDQPTPV